MIDLLRPVSMKIDCFRFNSVPVDSRARVIALVSILIYHLRPTYIVSSSIDASRKYRVKSTVYLFPSPPLYSHLHNPPTNRSPYRARTPPHTLAAARPNFYWASHVARHPPLVTRMPRFPLGGFSCLGLGGVRGGEFVATVSTLFRGTFEAV